MAISYLGPTTWEGQSAYHIRFWRAAPEQGAAEAAQIARLSQADVYLDANTLLPLALTYMSHPPGNDLVIIPVEIKFSAYQRVDGIEAPFRVQRWLNGTLNLDLAISIVQFNANLPASDFAIAGGAQ